ncbi:DUF3987 domain-containing protein [Rhodopila sp.]|uniref:DUF3987 domain-containing protein n=1 Tax=Rhodopila sp. TaxID=2480087 RepID=UPI003D14B31E
MTSDILDLTHAIREAAWRKGYRPVPIINPGIDVKGAGKRPAGSGLHWSHWEQDARQDPPFAVSSQPSARATNTGILCDGLQAVDIDVDDADLADAVDRLCVEMLGDAPMRYRDDSARRLRLFRAADGEPSHVEVMEDEAVAAGANRKPYGVEVLGKGNQFLAVGFHPDGAFLDWRDGRNPTTVPRDDLPAVTEDQVAEFLSLAGELIGAKPPRQNRQNRQNPAVVGHDADGEGSFGSFVMADRDAALADVLAALTVVAGDGGSYKVWIRVGMAIFTATNGSLDGLTAFDEWSRRSPRYDAAAVERAWRTFRPNSLTFGTLVHMVREVDPAWRAPSWDPRGRDPDIGADIPPTRIAVDILNRTVAPPPTLPLATFGCDWGGWLQQAAVVANAPVDYVATSLLAVMGSLIGNARWGQAWQGWAEPSVLWCALVGEPSSSKTPAAKMVLNLLRQVENDTAEGFDEIYAAWEESAARAKAARKQWEASVASDNTAPMPRTIVPPEPMRPLASTGSVTIEKVAKMMQAQPKGFLINNDELAGWLGNLQRYSGGNDRPFWLTAWTGSSYRVDRVTSATTIILHLSLGIFGTIQPDKLAATLKGADDGLPARFLFCWANARPFARPSGTVSVSRVTEALCRLARLQMAGSEDGSVVPVFNPATNGAADALTAFASEMQAQERQAGGLMIGVLGKARGYALRLAVALEYLQWAWTGDRSEPTEISAKAMRAAVELMRDYFLPMASRVLGDAAITQQERDARTLAKWIAAERPNKVNIRGLSRGETGGTAMHGLRDRKRLEAAADWLKDCGWLQHGAVGKTDGRPRSDHLIADGLWSALDDYACQNQENCHKSADVKTEEASGGFGGFVSTDTPADQPEVSDLVADTVGDDNAEHITESSGLPPLAPVPIILPPFRNGSQPDVPAGDGVSTLLDRMIAERRASDCEF